MCFESMLPLPLSLCGYVFFFFFLGLDVFLAFPCVLFVASFPFSWFSHLFRGGGGSKQLMSILTFLAWFVLFYLFAKQKKRNFNNEKFSIAFWSSSFYCLNLPAAQDLSLYTIYVLALLAFRFLFYFVFVFPSRMEMKLGMGDHKNSPSCLVSIIFCFIAYHRDFGMNDTGRSCPADDYQ